MGSAGSSLPIQYCCLGDQVPYCSERSGGLHGSRQNLKFWSRSTRIIGNCGSCCSGAYVRSNRYIGDCRAASLLTTTAALLSIASESPSHIVTIFPARCYAAQEWVLSEKALDQALAILPQIAKLTFTLGMVDLDDGIDEDSLIASRAVERWAWSSRQWRAAGLVDRKTSSTTGRDDRLWNPNWVRRGVCGTYLQALAKACCHGNGFYLDRRQSRG